MNNSKALKKILSLLEELRQLKIDDEEEYYDDDGCNLRGSIENAYEEYRKEQEIAQNSFRKSEVTTPNRETG